jgi:hypothetical protein
MPATVRKEGDVVWFAPPSTDCEETMQTAFVTLLREVQGCEDGSVRILLDLRGCSFRTNHLLFTIRALISADDVIRTVHSAVALIDQSSFSQSLLNAFFAMYTPSKPFAIEFCEDRARRFFAKAGCHASVDPSQQTVR